MRTNLVIFFCFAVGCTNIPYQKGSPLLKLKNLNGEPIVRIHDERMLGDTLTFRFELQPWCGEFASLLKAEPHLKDGQFHGPTKALIGRAYLNESAAWLHSDNFVYDGYTDLMLWDFSMEELNNLNSITENESKDPKLLLKRKIHLNKETIYEFMWINYGFAFGNVVRVQVSDHRGLVGLRLDDVEFAGPCVAGDWFE